MNIYFDIETIPCQAAGVKEELASSIKPPGTLKKPESIAEWEKTAKPDLTEEAWLKTSFDGGLGQMIAIAWAIDDGPVEWLYSPNTSLEGSRELLIDFFEDLKHFHSDRPVLVGHNVAGFDLPFIRKQAIRYNVKPPFWFPKQIKPWQDNIYDTMLQWDAKNFISMDKLCKILGLPGKDGITGADVWPMALEGKFEEIGAYCAKDVERTRSLYKRMTFGD
jgi:predicted PolB exonuclease-like 3'-5' exonuclease